MCRGQAMPYRGTILLGDQPRNWINRHKSFASEDWFRSHIHWGRSPWRWRNKNDFCMEVTEITARESLTIVIEASYYPQGTSECPFKHVLVRHAHTLRKKRR